MELVRPVTAFYEHMGRDISDSIFLRYDDILNVECTAPTTNAFNTKQRVTCLWSRHSDKAHRKDSETGKCYETGEWQEKVCLRW
jgi:hypothetical protein